MKFCLSMITVSIMVGGVFGQWLPDSDQKLLRGMIPKGVEYPSDIKFYNHEPCYQNNGLHSPKYNIAGRLDVTGNANMEFPWKTPSGLHESTGWSAYKAASIPGAIKVYNKHISPFSNESATIHWEFPENTVFLEMLLIKHGKYDYPFEVRTRTKQNGKWTPEVFRPYASASELPVMNKVQKRIVGFRVDSTIELHELPPMTIAWLDVPFKHSRLNYTTKYDQSIIPKGYLSTVTQCTDCHSQAGIHSREASAVRDWYGNVRGSDQIFSFHIFDERTISHNGYTIPIRFNPNLKLEQK